MAYRRGSYVRAPPSKKRKMAFLALKLVMITNKSPNIALRILISKKIKGLYGDSPVKFAKRHFRVFYHKFLCTPCCIDVYHHSLQTSDHIN